MTIPAFLDDTVVPVTNQTLNALVDIETGGVGIITSMRSMLVTTLGWTEPSTGLFKTPVDSAGRFMDVLLTRISSSVLEVRLRDQSATTIYTRRISLDTTGTSVFLWATTYSLLIETIRATPETAHAHILDVSPDAKTDTNQYVCGSAHLTAAGANDGNGDACGDFYMVDNGAATFRRRMRRDFVDCNVTYGVTASSMGKVTVFKPAMLGVLLPGPNATWAGRLYHAIVSHGTVGPGQVLSVNIDTSTIKQFRRCGLLTDDFTTKNLFVRIASLS